MFYYRFFQHLINVSICSLSSYLRESYNHTPRAIEHMPGTGKELQTENKRLKEDLKLFQELQAENKRLENVINTHEATIKHLYATHQFDRAQNYKKLKAQNRVKHMLIKDMLDANKSV